MGAFRGIVSLSFRVQDDESFGERKEVSFCKPFWGTSLSIVSWCFLGNSLGNSLGSSLMNVLVSSLMNVLGSKKKYRFGEPVW